MDEQNGPATLPEQMELHGHGTTSEKEEKKKEVKLEIDEEEIFHYDVFQTPPVIMLLFFALQVILLTSFVYY